MQQNCGVSKKSFKILKIYLLVTWWANGEYSIVQSSSALVGNSHCESHHSQCCDQIYKKMCLS